MNVTGETVNHVFFIRKCFRKTFIRNKTTTFRLEKKSHKSREDTSLSICHLLVQNSINKTSKKKKFTVSGSVYELRGASKANNAEDMFNIHYSSSFEFQPKSTTSHLFSLLHNQTNQHEKR